jgi:hypothetical protein
MSESIWAKLAAIDRRVLYWIHFILLMVPFLSPLGLPVKIAPNTRDLWEGINAPNVEPGDYAIIDLAYGVSAWSECMPGVVVCTKALLRNGVKIIFIGPYVDHELTYNQIVYNKAADDFADKTYGEDWVFLGYLTGAESAIAQLARDFRSIYPVDFFGNDLDDLPMMVGVNDHSSIELVLSSDTGDWGSYFLRQWQAQYGTRLAQIGIAMLGSTGVPLWQAGNYFGLSVGSRGGAELEALIGEPDDATISMDSISVSHVFVVFAVLLANIGYFAMRSREER